MTERRWIHEEGCPAEVRGALDRAAQARMGPETRARLVHRLEPMLGPEGGGGPGQPVPTGAGRMWWLWAAAGIGVIGAMIATMVVPRGSPSEPSRVVAPLVHPAPPPVTDDSSFVEPTTEVQASEQPAPTEPPRMVASHRARASRETAARRESPQSAPSPEPAAAPTSGPSELELLTGARQRVRSDPRAAIALLTRHAELFPRGVFAEEREVLAVEAHSRSGDTRAARIRAEAFVRAHPHTAHRARLVHFVGSLSETP